MVKVVRNKKWKFFSHRCLIEFYETNRKNHVPHLYDMEFKQASLMAAKNAQTTLCLKGCNICLQEDWRVKVGSMSP